MSVRKTTDPAKKAKLAEWLRKSKAAKSPTGSEEIALAPRGEQIPLTFGQERLWFLQQLDPGNPFYHYVEIFQIEGSLDLGLLQEAFLGILQRHSVLRTTFHRDESRLIQIVQPTGELEWKIWDYSSTEIAFEEAQIRERIIREVSEAFDLERGPLLRVNIIRLTSTEHWMVLCFHHIVVDKQSVRVILLNELAKFYGDSSLSLPKPELAYKDFAYFHRKKKSSPKDLAYWKGKLGGEAPVLALPVDRQRPSTPTYKGAFYSRSLPNNTAHKVSATCKELGITPFIYLLAVYKVLLFRYCREEDIWVGSPFTNRDQVALERVMGFFNETLVLRSTLKGEMTFEEVLRIVKKTVLEAFSHKNLPFDVLVSELNPDRTLGVNPLFQVMFLYDDSPFSFTLDEKLKVTHKLFDYGVSKFDLTLMLSRVGKELKTVFEYSTELFEEPTIQTLQESYARLLNAVLETPETPISKLPLLGLENERQLLLQGASKPLPLPGYTSIYAYLEEQCLRNPESIAVRFQEEAISYSALDDRARRLAGTLALMEMEEGSRVGLCAQPSIELIIGIWGIIRAGGAYVPLDPVYPIERLEYMVQEARVETIVLQDSFQGMFTDSRVRLISLEQASQDSSYIDSIPELNTLSDQSEVYTIFTSGSSGKPKGVPITHKNLIHSTLARKAYYQDDPTAFLLLSSFSFDSSVAGIFWTLCTGGTLVLTEKRTEQDIGKLSRIIEKYGITHSLMLPSLYSVLLRHGELSSLNSLNSIIVAGESCPSTLVDTHFSQLPEVHLYNEYGPTEASVWCSVHQIQPEDSQGSVPIGKAIANTELWVLDSDQQLLPIGAEGELYVGGLGLATGYLNRPELTEEKFIPHPYSSEEGARLYRTGDLVRMGQDGTLLFSGRADSQVKIRGFRIELDEITQVLLSLPELEEACTLVSANKELIGYYQSKQEVPAKDLRRFIARVLPEYMVPSHFIWMAQFPKLPNGKIDRKNLPEPSLNIRLDSPNYLAPSTPFETKMVSIWEKILGKQPIGINDNFFELGGDSLLSIHLLAESRNRGIELATTQLFEHPTIRSLNRAISGETEAPVQNGNQLNGHDPTGIPTSFNPEVELSPEEMEIIFRQIARNG